MSSPMDAARIHREFSSQQVAAHVAKTRSRVSAVSKQAGPWPGPVCVHLGSVSFLRDEDTNYS